MTDLEELRPSVDVDSDDEGEMEPSVKDTDSYDECVSVVHNRSSFANKLKETTARLDELLVNIEVLSTAIKKMLYENAVMYKKEENALPSENIADFETPKLFVGSLNPHQISGVKWMKILADHDLGGILADEMGLGKTVQVIALICHLIENNITGPFLIVTPLSVLNNWELEFQRFAPEIPFIRFAGTKDHRQSLYQSMRKKKVVMNTSLTPVILTTYDIALREKILTRFKWKFIIVDEGHRLKNSNSKLYSKLNLNNCCSRILLTGTPLQNDLGELWSLLRFVLPNVIPTDNLFAEFLGVAEFETEAERILFQEEKRILIDKIHQLLLPFVLRRMKAGIIHDLPPKKETIIYVPLTKTQLELYTATLNGTLSADNNKEEDKWLSTANSPPKKRKCTLKKCVYITNSSDTEYSDSEDSEMSDTSCSVSRSSPPLFESEHITANYDFNGLDESSNCESSVCDLLLNQELYYHSVLMGDRNEIPDENELAIDGSLLGFSSVEYLKVFKKMCEFPILENPLSGQSEEDLALENLYMRKLLSYRLMSEADTVSDCPSEDDEFEGFPHDSRNDIVLKLLSQPVIENCINWLIPCCGESDESSTKQRCYETKSSKEGITYSFDIKKNNLGMQLRKIANHPYLVKMPIRNGVMDISRDLITSSSKFMVLESLLPGLKEGGHKVLIFSTFKIVLDLLETFLQMMNYRYCRLDGDSNLEERTYNIKKFCSSESDVFVFLMTTRAGGLGLNLIAADTVFIFDSEWNPQMDLQAQDRCHRIGQTKPVNVYRLVTKETIDEIIMKKAHAKRKLEKVVILEGKFTFCTEDVEVQLDQDKLKQLLESSLAHNVIDSGDSVLKPHQIERLLERKYTSDVEDTVSFIAGSDTIN